MTSIAARRFRGRSSVSKSFICPRRWPAWRSCAPGLILLTGITGTGKSTTIAAMLEEINRTRACHIMTLEDPIEFVYQDKMAFVNQREVGLDVGNYSDAFKYMMREDPDVVLIGELRDQETYGAALSAAETGHLVFGTIHASSRGWNDRSGFGAFSGGARPWCELRWWLTSRRSSA